MAVLGVGAHDERVYRALARRADWTVEDLAEELATDRAPLLRSLALLEARGLAAPAVGGPGRYAATSAVATGLLDQQQARLREVEQALTDIADGYRKVLRGQCAEVVDVVRGASAARRRVGQLAGTARRETLSFVLPTGPQDDWPDDTAVELADGDGVMHRTVWTAAVLERRGMAGTLPVAGSAAVRIVRRLPLRMLIVDRAAALVPLGTAQGVVLVRPSGILDAFVALFDAVWAAGLPLGGVLPPVETPPCGGSGSRGAPASGPGVPGVQEIDARILSLLLVGLTDRSVAVQLGLSMRTVQRRVRRLMDLAGVQTRLQLGWFAARNDWV